MTVSEGFASKENAFIHGLTAGTVEVTYFFAVFCVYSDPGPVAK